jgi:hypothetical protein
MRMVVQGYLSVYNRREDFYKCIENDAIPKDYDVLITNPPYSGDNIERLVTFCLASRKPFFLLMPNYVYTKVSAIRVFIIE